ncbi:hypothetical protein TSOC_008752 [Tetrabaena socialis]|uniref:Uncharacterized protein n=1 Tax=Tetrabaena socialis TaxID=47790 RepID=A0A2J7ZXP1_9CHLO|nr:hypothetical protein TSOC_008752 [Tetrabaena socialis]|eukprot:PNH05037.1 hypothetical protein TSOC_008752 [Tetrabaena socialis]
MGHFVPCLALSTWAFHAFIGTCWRYCLAQRDPSAPPYTSRTWEPLLPFLPSPRWRRFNQLVPIDSLFKTISGSLIIITSYRFPQIVCPDGVREGRIVGQHVMYWAHAMLIVACVLVGVVELVAIRVRFPPGTSAAVMVAAHIVLVIIFSYHQKVGNLVGLSQHLLPATTAPRAPGPNTETFSDFGAARRPPFQRQHEIFDQTIHELVGHCFFVAAICGVMEVYQPTSFLAVSGKLFFHIMGSAWLGMAGYMLFSGSVFWSPVWNAQTDVGPVMFAPIVFIMMMLGLLVFMLIIFALVDLLAARRLRAVGPDAPEEAMLALTQLPISKMGGERQGLLVKSEAAGGYSAINGQVDGDALGSSGLGGFGVERSGCLVRNGRA